MSRSCLSKGLSFRFRSPRKYYFWEKRKRVLEKKENTLFFLKESPFVFFLNFFLFSQKYGATLSLFLHIYIEEEISHLRLWSHGSAESGSALAPQPPSATGVGLLAWIVFLGYLREMVVFNFAPNNSTQADSTMKTEERMASCSALLRWRDDSWRRVIWKIEIEFEQPELNPVTVTVTPLGQSPLSP